MKGQFPWIGRSRGSAGGMTTAKVNDKNIMRAKAFEVTNPKTAAQVMQRDFFKDVQEVCASVTEDQLRSLFGVKPKTMTRRNALSKQVAKAYSIDGTTKSVDLSKLQAIGNGSKISTPLQESSTDDGIFQFNTENVQMPNNPSEVNAIVVVFDPIKQRIILFNTDYPLSSEQVEVSILDLRSEESVTVYGYVTYAEGNQNVYDRGFGSFIIKTRATD